MHRTAIAAAFALACLTAPRAEAAAPSALEPTSQWRIDYGQERCSLLRQFGDPEDGVLLEIASFGSRTTFRFTLIGTPIPRTPLPASMLRLRFSPDTEDRDIRVLRGTRADKRAGALFTAAFAPFKDDIHGSPSAEMREAAERAAQPQAPDVGFEEQTTALLLKFGAGKQVELHTGRMTKPLAALRTCVDDLQHSWGIDPAVQKALSRVAAPAPSTVKGIQTHYPDAMVMNGLSAYVPVRVMVGPDGAAGACVVQVDGVDPAFAKAVCDGLGKRFEPALDAQGRPVASLYQSVVVYLID